MLTDEEFQKQMLGQAAESKKTLETLMRNYDQLGKETKQAMEDFTKAKNEFATVKNVDEVLRKMQLMQLSLQREARSAWGSPAQRIAQTAELRNLFAAKLVHQLKLREYIGGTALEKAIAPILKDLDEANTPGSAMIANNELERELYDGLLRYGAFRTLNVRPVGAKTTELRIKTARAAAAFVDEAAVIGADATKAGTKTALTLKKIGTLISVSNELLEDDITGCIEEIIDDIMQSFAEKLDWISFTADGTADALDGGFTGMFYGGTAAGAAAGNVSFAALDYEDYVKCLYTVNAATLQRQARWWIHPTVLAQALLIKDGNGRPIFNTAIEAPSLGAIGTILGFPVTTVGNAPSTDGVSKKVAAFGDPDGQAVRIRKDIRVERSDQWAFDTDEVTFRGVQRAASKTRLATSFAILTTAAA